MLVYNIPFEHGLYINMLFIQFLKSLLEGPHRYITYIAAVWMNHDKVFIQTCEYEHS